MTPLNGKNSEKATAFIFAKGSSRGCVGKNIRLMNGKPLLAYAIEQARASNLIDKVVVSTDCMDIASVALDYGAIVLERPKELAQDDSAEWLAWQHAVQNVECTAFVSVPATCPLRETEDIDNCILARTKDMAITVTIRKTNPFFTMATPRGKFLQLSSPGLSLTRRQDAPLVYDIVGVAYAADPQFILNNESMWDGLISPSFVPVERAIDIDTEFDFKTAELLIKDRE